MDGLVLLEPIDARLGEVVAVGVDLVGADDLGEGRDDLRAFEGGEGFDHDVLSVGGLRGAGVSGRGSRRRRSGRGR